MLEVRYTMPRTPDTKKYNLRHRREKNKESSSSEESNESDDYEDVTDEGDMMDEKEYKRFLHKLFPSRNMSKQIKEMDRIDKLMDEEKKEKSSKQVKKSSKNIVKKNKKVESESESSDNSEMEEDSDEDSDGYGGNQKINIVFTIGDGLEYEEGETETDESMECDSEEEDEEDEEEPEEKIEYTETDKEILDQFIKKTDQLSQEKQYKNSNMINQLKEYANKKSKEIKKQEEKSTSKIRRKNTDRFKKALRQKRGRNDISFFKKLDINRQEKIIAEMNSINKDVSEDPYRLQILEANMPHQFKAVAMKKINNLRHMEASSGEYYKIKNWVDTFMQIPFGKHAELPVSLEKDGQESCHDFMADAVKTLDDAVYGLNDAKMQIMQMVGQWLTNPQAVGNAIAIKGPPGTGKTTLVKYGISKILKRDFAFLALGGATDSSFLEGHSYTYEGSTWGKIVDILVQSNCMNPVIYFDELDKISDSPKGEEITGILTHLTDTTQNDKFHDKYFSEIEFDLSKCLFIFSYNDESKVNPILKDRMYRIETKGYESPQKLIIANKYLLPTIREQVKFDSKDITIDDEAMKYIMSTFCGDEKGVRNLKRCLEIIHTKLNLYRLMKEGTNLFQEDLTLKVTFPINVTREMIDKLIKKDKEPNWVSHLYI